MKLYKELAEWWPLMSPHTEYEEEAAIYAEIIQRHHPGVKKAVEFGSGGGSNAFYLKQHFPIVLTDLSSDMLAVSRQLNPDCEHLQGDMRTLDAGAGYDLVFIHDAITYFKEADDLLKTFRNAKRHLNADGLLLIMTDQFTETFTGGTSHGGIDKGDRGMRYLEWTYDRDPNDHMTETHYLYMMRNEEGKVFTESDSSQTGLFSIPEWKGLLKEAGFFAVFEPVRYSTEAGEYYAIVARLSEDAV